MIETHIHILSQIDDGPQNFPESMQLVKAFKNEGIQNIIATPHFWQGYWEPSKEEIQKKVKTLNTAITQLKWNITLFPGCELRLTPDLFSKCSLSSFQTLNNSFYLLVDVYPDLTKNHYQQLKHIKKSKLTPILAHPERYESLKQEENVQKIIDIGVILQLVNSSLLSQKSSIKKQALHFLKNDYYSIIGSDSHNNFDQLFLVSETKKEIIDTVGEKKFELLTETNCAKILNNQPIEQI